MPWIGLLHPSTSLTPFSPSHKILPGSKKYFRMYTLYLDPFTGYLWLSLHVYSRLGRNIQYLAWVMSTVQAAVSLASVSSQDQSCNRIFGLIPASQAWFTGSFGEVFELSNIFFPLICYLPKGSLRGNAMMCFSSVFVMCLIQFICILSDFCYLF